jgi:hypothetical protein
MFKPNETSRREAMKTYKVWAKQTTYHYALITAEDDEQAFDKAINMDASEFIDGNHIDWDIYSTEETKND